MKILSLLLGFGLAAGVTFGLFSGYWGIIGTKDPGKKIQTSAWGWIIGIGLFAALLIFIGLKM